MLRMTFICGAVAEWSCSGLQSRTDRFDSCSRLSYVENLRPRYFSTWGVIAHPQL
jgi:hypothetical protein